MPAITRTTIVYSKVRDNVLTKWPAGARLPSERDLAAEYGVSTVTVSRALAELTRDGLIYRIPGMGTFVNESAGQPAAPATDFRALARRVAPKGALSRTATPVTGIVADLGPRRSDKREYDQAIWRHMAVSEVERAVQMAGGRTIVIDLYDVPEREHADRLAAMVAAGANNIIVVAVTNVSQLYNLGVAVYQAATAEGRHIPVVWAETDKSTVWPFDGVRFDCRKAVFDATEHLISLGHRRIAMLAPGATMQWAVERIEGFRQAMDVNGVPVPEGAIILAEDISMAEDNYWQRVGRDAAERLLASPTPFTAAVCGNDTMSVELARLASERGLSVPGELSIVGFDDSIVARQHGLATVQLDSAAFGREAAQQALRRVSDPATGSHAELVLGGRLVLRASTGAPA